MRAMDELFAAYNRGYNVGVGGAVVEGDRILFVRRASSYGRGNWQIPGGFCDRNETLDQAIELIGHPNCYPNYDPTNLYVVGSDPLRAFDVFGARIASGHIKDGLFRIGQRIEKPVGEGEVDYAAIFTEMMRRGLSVNMHIEHCNTEDAVRAAARHIRGVLDGLA